MKLCSHCMSPAMAEAGGCRSYWFTFGPPARSFTAHTGSAHAAPRTRASRLNARPRDRIVIICGATFREFFGLSVLGGRSAGRPAQRRAQLVGQGGAQLGAHEPADGDVPPLAGKLDQRAVAIRGLDPDPGGRHEIGLLDAPPEGAGDAKAAPPQHQAFVVGRMAGVDED